MTNERPRPRTRGNGTVLFRVRGVPIVVSASWLLVGLLLPIIYGPVLQDAVPGLGATPAYAAAFGFAIVFGGCVLAHELGHTLVSVRLGHPVRRIVLFALGGVSEIESEPERPRDELLIAAAGPLVSVLITAAAWLGTRATTADTLLAALVALLFWSNLVLAGFNLLPGLPLDGGRLLSAAIRLFGARPLTATRVASWSGRAIAVGVLIAGLVVDRTSGGVAAGLFTAALAGYLWFAATRSLKVAELLEHVSDVRLADLLRPGMFVPDDITVAEGLQRAWGAHARGLVLVDGADRPTAIVDEAMAGAVPPERRPWTPITEVARPLEPGLTLPEDLDGPALLHRMQSTPAHEYLVVRPDGRAAGILSAVDLVRRLQVSR